MINHQNYSEELKHLSGIDFVKHLKQKYTGYKLKDMISHPEERMQSVASEILSRPGLYTSIHRYVNLHLDTGRKMPLLSNVEISNWTSMLYSSQTSSYLGQCDPLLEKTLRERKNGRGISLREVLINRGVLINGDMARPDSGRKPFRANRKRIIHPEDTFHGRVRGPCLSHTRYGKPEYGWVSRNR